MERFSIITDTKAMHDILLKRISAEAGSEAAVDAGENSVILTSEDENSKKRIFDVISKTIVDEYENKLISKLINQNYFYFNLPDRRTIYNKAIEYSENESENKNLVAERLKEYLATTDEIMLDGFVNFRLKDYQNELEGVIDRAVDDFMVEKEYKEFIKLLKYFVEIQKPKYELLNIIPYKGGYLIYDEKLEDVTGQCIKDFMRETEKNGISSDDLLISALISIAPKRLCIHQPHLIENSELLLTIKQVFAKRITSCEGCDLCNRIINESVLQ